MIQQLDSKTYHARDEISKHGLDLIFRAPALYQHHKNNPQEQTPAMRWGEIVHTAVLEPQRFKDEYVVAPEDLKKTAKKAWAEFEESNVGKSIITQDESEVLSGTLASLMSNKIVRGMISKIREEGGIEQSVFWEMDGIKCRARPDGFSKSMQLVADLKTCINASKEIFSKDAYSYRYHVQAAFYLDGLQSCGIDVQNFVFICVEKTAPYLVSVYVADDEMISFGRNQYKKDLEKYAQCVEENNFPGYPQEIQPLSLPSYAK